MKIHLAWIRVTAAAAFVAGVGVHPAAAQYAPFRPIPQQPAAPQPAPAAPAAAYVAYRPQPAYQQAPVMPYQAPTARYQAPVAAQYPRTAVSPYPQTAAQYPAAYGAYPYVAQQAPTEAMPAPQKNAGPGAGNGAPAAGAPAAEGMPAPGEGAPGAPAAGCNCAAGAGCATGDNYTAAGCGCNGAYPGISNYLGESCDNQWFGGVYYLFMDRSNPRPVRLTVEVPAGSTYPYYPPASTTVVSTRDVDYGFRSGVEVRLGSTFTIGDSCSSGNSCSSGYSGCGCQPSCNAPTTYAWEVAWWGIENDANTSTFQDQVNTRIYGMKNFVGLEYNNNSAYGYSPVNSYYGYGLPIQAPPGAPPDGSIAVLAQRVRTDFQAQDLELNFIRFPVCDTCAPACGGGNGGCGAGYDTCGCNASGCEDSWTSNVSAYGSCGVRYFHIKDTFSYDTEFTQYTGGVPDQAMYNGFTFDNSNELMYDVQVKNDLIGPQLGWTTNYSVGCRWNFFCNSTFGIFDNHMTQTQRMWSGGGGVIRFAGTSQPFNVSSNKDDVAFLGECRVGSSYDINCHWRGVLAYRAVAMTGIATSTAQIPSQFSSRAEVVQINSDNSLVVHGVQVGAECRY